MPTFITASIARKQQQLIIKDLENKIVFIVGPRQVGKTWLAKTIAQLFANAVYLNYDHMEDRQIILDRGWRANTELLILDELHKMSDWKNYLKGIFDTKPSQLKILVTGSAKLDIFRQAGDSLAGRFFVHRLLPFSPAELSATNAELACDVDRFITRGGFPEPFLLTDPIDADRWRMQYVDSLLRDDVFTFNQIDNINNMRLVLELLKTKVGSPIAYSSIAEDVHIAPNTVKKYIEIFESLFIVFRVTPFAKNIARSLAKEPKLYFFDVGLVKGDIGAKLENFVAVCLLKHVYAMVDYTGQDYALHYLRTKDGIEVDFALARNGEIEQTLEVKTRDKSLSKPLLHFRRKYNFRAVQLVHELRQERGDNSGIEIVRLINFLLELI